MKIILYLFHCNITNLIWISQKSDINAHTSQEIILRLTSIHWGSMNHSVTCHEILWPHRRLSPSVVWLDPGNVTHQHLALFRLPLTAAL